MTTRSILRTAAGMSLAAMTVSTMTACSGSLNESNTMYRANAIPAFQEEREATEFSDATSVDGLDRTNWEPTVVLVSSDDVASHPTLGKAFTMNRYPSRRQAGKYPTIESALDIDESNQDKKVQYIEMVVQPFQQVLNMFLIPVFVVTKDPPGTVDHGAQFQYRRYAGGTGSTVLLFPGEDYEAPADPNVMTPETMRALPRR